jgi:pimeloyl-ACP methyl ester carboxylesterase
MTRIDQPGHEISTTVRSDFALELARTGVHMAYGFGDSVGAALATRLFTTPRRHPRPARERAILATGHAFPIEVPLDSPRWKGAQRRIAAWRWGEGPSVLLVHGWEGRGSQLCAFIEPLVEAGMSVVAFDAPGHGDSTGRQLYLSDAADAIGAVVARIGPVHGIIAHSFGAPGVLLAHHRHGVDAARNVFIAPNVLIDDAVFRFTQLMQLGGHERALLEDRLSAHTGLPMSALTLETLIGDRDAAMLVLHDDGDRDVAPIHGRRLAQVWPGAKLITTDGLGHRRILRDPGVIAGAVAFVTAGAPTATSDLRRALLDGWVEDIDPARLVPVRDRTGMS